jgi:hypothetical protein
MNADDCDGAAHANASERLWRYSAPELICSLSPAARTLASDSYALGCLLWEALTCQQLWQGLGQAQVRALMQRRLRPPTPEFFAPHVSALLHSCWAELPAERPMPAEILFRLAGGGKSTAYMYLPKSTMRSSLRNSRSSEDSAPRISSVKSVKWALPQEHALDTTAVEVSSPSHSVSHQTADAPAFPSMSLPDNRPLNVAEQTCAPYIIPAQSSLRPDNTQCLPGARDIEQPALRLPLLARDGNTPAPLGDEAHIVPQAAVNRPVLAAAAATRFSLQLGAAVVDNRDDLLQTHQHQHVSPPPAMRSPPAPRPPESPHHQPATPALLSHAQVPSPSKPSAGHYDVASSIAAHVLAAKQLAGSSGSAVVDKRDFARSVGRRCIVCSPMSDYFADMRTL